jgi:hypothetical protein
MTHTTSDVIKFRNVVFPFSFPAWINGHLGNMQANQVHELEGKIIYDNGTYTRIRLAADLLTDGDNIIEIEWLNQWFEQIKEFSPVHPGLDSLEDES